MSNTTNRIKLPYILQSQSQKEVTHNSGLDLIDILLQAAVISANVNTPPKSPLAGNCYIVGQSPTDAWIGQTKALAFYTTGWNFIVPWEGLTVWVSDASALTTYNGKDWIATFRTSPAANGRKSKANASGLISAGVTQHTATAIINQNNEFTAVAAKSGAILPSPEPGEFIFVANAGANALNVYPASGHSINTLVSNAAFVIEAGKNCIFWAVSNNKWYATA